MSGSFSLPYLTADSDSATAGNWHYRTKEGVDVLLGDTIPGWDYDFDVVFRRALEVDGKRVKADCGLPSSCVLRSCVIAHSRAARYREVVWTSEPFKRDLTADVEITIRGSLLAEELQLQTLVVLERDSARSKLLAARHAGSRLWEEVVTCRLEGTGSRFPVECIDFAERLSYLDSPNALWYFDFSTADLNSPARSQLRIYLNTRHKTLIEAAVNADPVLSDALSAEASRRLIAAGLDEPDFSANPADFEAGSLGQAIARIFQLSFPNSEVAEVRALRESQPARFEAMIQSGTVTFDED